MALEMRKECEACQAPLSDDGVAFICSYECTYCASCAEAKGACPNCQGELLPRPRRGSLEGAPSMTLERLGRFNQAWLDADLETLAELITDDCVYAASVGPEPGKTYSGRAEVEAGFREILAYEAGGEADGGPVHLYGNRAFSHWSYSQTLPDGRTAVVRGCDFFEFDGDRIRRKDAFIKTLPLSRADR